MRRFEDVFQSQEVYDKFYAYLESIGTEEYLQLYNTCIEFHGTNLLSLFGHLVHCKLAEAHIGRSVRPGQRQHRFVVDRSRLADMELLLETSVATARHDSVHSRGGGVHRQH